MRLKHINTKQPMEHPPTIITSLRCWTQQWHKRACGLGMKSGICFIVYPYFSAGCEGECEPNTAAEVIYDDVPSEDPLCPDEGQ